MARQDRQQRIDDIQAALRRASRLAGSAGLAGVDGWLFYDFRHSDPIAYRILFLDPTQHVTRRWYYWVPADGRPVKLSHRIEPHVLDELPGETLTRLAGRMAREDVPAGRTIVSEGDPGDRFYVLLSGMATVTQEVRGARSVLRPGDTFGEVALAMGIPRTATVTAMLPSVVASCDRATFDELLRPLFADDE